MNTNRLQKIADLSPMAYYNSSGANRRVRKAMKREDYVQMSYYRADHMQRFGVCAWQYVTTRREAFNFTLG